MRIVAVAAILMTVTLAGCATGPADPVDEATAPVYAGLDELSQKIYDILPVEELFVGMSDGKAMHTAIYRPDTNETVPVFINFSPYWGDTAETGGDAFSQYMIDEYVPRGYAVVLAAIRGTGHSEGCFSIGGDRELQDLYEVVDHFANAEWSNGNIASGGKSYDSTTQNGMIAKFPHPALKGIFHVSGITDMYRYNYHYGYPTQQGTVFNTYYYAQGTDEYGASLVGAGGTDNEDAASLARLADDVACPDLPIVQANGVGSGVTGLKSDYWIERDWTRYIGDSEWNGSIYFVHGLQDWNVMPDNVLPWLDNLPEQVREKTLIWLHQETDNGGHLYPMRTDWNETMLRWLDHNLKGIDTGLFAEPHAQIQGSDGTWRSEDYFPSARVNMTDFALADATVVSTPGQPDKQEVVVATAGDEALRYSGQATLTLKATSTGPDPALTAVLYDEAPDGGRTWTNEAVLRGIYRDGLDMPSPVVPGQATEYELMFFPQDDVLEPGHSWVLVVGDRLHETLQAGVLVDPNVGLVGQNGVSYDLSAAMLHLPMAPVDGAVEPQPTRMPCIAC